MIEPRHKNAMMDVYYRMRQQDSVLQNYFHFEEELERKQVAEEEKRMKEGISFRERSQSDVINDNAKIIAEYMERRHDCVLDIFRLLKELGLPFLDV